MAFRIIVAERSFNRSTRAICMASAGLLLTCWTPSETLGQETRFFVSQSQSLASRVAGSTSRRVSLGPTPPSAQARRLHEDRTVPFNQLPGLRAFDKDSQFRFSRAFRDFGIERRGAQDAPGAPDAPPQ